MIFTETKLAGAFVIDLEPREDNRGFFARTFCQHEFAEHGLNPVIAQANVAFNKSARHAARDAFPVSAGGGDEARARCTRGAIVDIIVDLRPESPTYLEHVAVELTDDNRRALYVPSGSRTGTRRSTTNRDELPGRRVLHARTEGGCCSTILASASSGRCR